ncbi:MAG TPA: DUF6491 family protein [Rhizomicrobium sp.]|nr:DUF6491 family protein [Rhizomicrobium sp.]
MRKLLLLALGTAMLAGQAMAEERACLRVGQIYDWKAQDNSTLIVEDTFHRKFKVDLLGSCINLTFKQRIGFASPGGTSLSCLTGGDSVFFRDSALGKQKCSVKAVSAYTPEMEKADKDAEAAKKAADVPPAAAAPADAAPKDTTPKGQ